MAIKYRAENAEGTLLETYVRSYDKAEFDRESFKHMVNQEIISDDEWHLAILDLQSFIDLKKYDGSTVGFFRIDPLQGKYFYDEDGKILIENGGLAMAEPFKEGANIDIAYAGFFQSEEAAKEYEKIRSAE